MLPTKLSNSTKSCDVTSAAAEENRPCQCPAGSCTCSCCASNGSCRCGCSCCQK